MTDSADSSDLARPEMFLGGLQSLVTVSTFLSGTEFVIFALLLEIGTDYVLSPAGIFALVASASVGFILVNSSLCFFISVASHVTRDLTSKEDDPKKNSKRYNIELSEMRAEVGIILFVIGLVMYPIPIIATCFYLDVVIGAIVGFTYIFAVMLYFVVRSILRNKRR